MLLLKDVEKGWHLLKLFSRFSWDPSCIAL